MSLSGHPPRIEQAAFGPALGGDRRQNQLHQCPGCYRSSAAREAADPAAINIRYFVSEPQSIRVVAQAVQPQALCPKCQHPSTSLHSHYQRSIADLPWHGVTVSIQLQTRKFRCRNELCLQKVFCERLPKVALAYARKTVRLNAALTLLAFALGGEAGARTASGLSLRVSGDTLLRRIRELQ